MHIALAHTYTYATLCNPARLDFLVTSFWIPDLCNIQYVALLTDCNSSKLTSKCFTLICFNVIPRDPLSLLRFDCFVTQIQNKNVMSLMTQSLMRVRNEVDDCTQIIVQSAC